MEGIDFEQMRQGRRIHKSRNPKIVRVLVDLGYMRDQGEGIPRIYAELEQVGTEPTHDQTEFTFRMVVPSLLDEERSQLEDKNTPVLQKTHQLEEENTPVLQKTHQFLQTQSKLKQKVMRQILAACTDWKTAGELADILGKSDTKHLVRTYLTPMVQAQILERRGEANAANQAYRRISQ